MNYGNEVRDSTQEKESIAKVPYTMYSEPSQLEREIVHRLEHYNVAIEKCELELRQLHILRRSLQDGLKVFNEGQAQPGGVAAGFGT